VPIFVINPLCFVEKNGHQQKCWWLFYFHSILSYSMLFYVALLKNQLTRIFLLL